MLGNCCIRNGSLHQTLITLLDQFQPNSFSFSVVKQIHALLIVSGFSKQHLFASKLFSLFADSGNADYTHHLLLHNPSPSVVHWNRVIRSFSNNSTPNKSIKVFVEMQQFGIIPDHYTFPFLVKASARLASIEHGMSLHSLVLKSGYQLDIFVQNSLIHMYAACGEILYARKVFDEMRQRTNVTWNSMLDGYAKCGDLKRAREVFEFMPDKDIVSWSSLIDGYVKGGEYGEALKVFDRMMVAGEPKANEVTMVSVLGACSHLGALEQGRLMHRYIVENKLSLNLVLLTSLVDMYAKCGAIEEALVVFRTIPKHKTDVLLWNAIIGGLASHGYVQESLELFVEMSKVRVAPDEITYLCLLSACVHRGLVKEAWEIFESLKRNGMIPKSEHYACLIDVMARAGQVGEAYDFLNEMPLDPTPAMLGALLSGCMSHGRLDLAELLGKRLVEVDPHHDGRYVGLSNLYATIKRWDDAKMMRQAMDITGVKKFPGFSYVEISGKLEMFIAHDKRHPKSVDIYMMVNFLLRQMKKVSDCDEGNTLY
ncbi:pentatricopeptide repeat-containing protein At5g08305 [Beta vulgaris subsp. vulgaris]|uniref:pentatricopeptide repeat-containing protein At5g08305 n=1 Tax=Beta vulgaris subsp. vulgaris TaxID=3555 RepID=UPI002036744C|nr:pentatricopeptide repeat-containing protein At5g08305 [Beta vulgaris subsp. vulgaris]XP_048493989.1 pentatricopeptide repeat-containing protein At5g08305 [Beta vulgaris subsp. vulgaris]XP_048493990.1 pentatricopeptide repeat-containing protein At5g08305 [Beta vulgaris subsp. vulgaris]XP_048493991.1 pentatricopeptide repeat-containing protein At5g08305 [Beta vulgaris subsp. vulgaris]